ncbi:hypothetical protein DFH08DRAFT_822550 [Mycena albidolilacea]|uniref:Uncharacterized protein n=1 Tax=Mycena albidolilacea TaxID=1033008 RepID=A0AAD7EC91_9AGAR|nr:hypothetical protein DFH08DRAFT_822550 [Mycena albidolilacea]
MTPPLLERFTHTQLFREYPWLSDAFVCDNWFEAATAVKGLTDYASFLVELDQRVPPANSTAHCDAEFRALLGLDNVYHMVRDQVAANSKAVAQTWTTLLRFQVLDVLLAMRWGISDTPDQANRTWENEVKKIEKESKKKAGASKAKARTLDEDQDEISPAPSTSVVESEAWSLVQKLSGMTTRSLLQKTTKNLQAMGTALTWILESRAFADDLFPLSIRVNDLYDATPAVAQRAGTLKIVDLLRPLSYALNSSFLTVFCDLDLQKEFGNVMHQYETRLFLGRYRSPRLAYMEELMLTVVRDIAIGTPVDAAISKFLAKDSEVPMELPPIDTADQTIFIPSDHSNIRLAATANRKRTKTRPLELAVPELPCSRVIATALASTICQVTDSAPGSSLDWASLVAFEDGPAPESELGAGSGSGPGSVVGPAEGAASDGQLVPMNVDHNVDITRDDTDDIPAWGSLADVDRVHLSTPNLDSTHADAEGKPLKKRPRSNSIPDTTGRASKRSGDELGEGVVSGSGAAVGAAEGATSDGQLNVTGAKQDLDDRITCDDTVDNVPPGSTANIEEDQSSMPDSNSTQGDVKGTTSKKILRSHSTPNTERRTSKRSSVLARLTGGKKDQTSTQDSELVEAVLDSDAPSDDAKTKPRKKMARPRPPASKKPNTDSRTVRVVEPLSAVERMPPKLSQHPVSMWGLRPDGTKREFKFQLHENSSLTAECRSMRRDRCWNSYKAQSNDNNSCVVKRRSCGTSGQLPTRKPEANEPALYVLTDTEWKSLSQLERTRLYETGRNIFIMGMVIGDIGAGVEESLSMLHRLDDEMEVQVRIVDMSSAVDWTSREVAYRQTAGLWNFNAQSPPDEKKWFDIAGTKWTSTLGHLDAAGGTVVGPQGDGEKYWIMKRDDLETVHDSDTYRTWDPDRPDFESGRYEGLVLPARGGILLMQNVEHIVLGLPPEGAANSPGSLSATWITGGHYFVATRIRPALSVQLHLVMLERVLTNVEHDAQWQFWSAFARFGSTLMTELTVRPPEDMQLFEAYLPTLDECSTKGWMDIVCLACLVILSTPLGSSRFLGRSGNAVIDWENDVFTASPNPMLLHLAQVVVRYHKKESKDSSNFDSDALAGFGAKVVKKNVVEALERYSAGLGTKLAMPPQHSRFWLFSGDEFSLQALF